MWLALPVGGGGQLGGTKKTVCSCALACFLCLDHRNNVIWFSSHYWQFPLPPLCPQLLLHNVVCFCMLFLCSWSSWMSLINFIWGLVYKCVVGVVCTVLYKPEHQELGKRDRALSRKKLIIVYEVSCTCSSLSVCLTWNGSRLSKCQSSCAAVWFWEELQHEDNTWGAERLTGKKRLCYPRHRLRCCYLTTEQVFLL